MSEKEDPPAPVKQEDFVSTVFYRWELDQEKYNWVCKNHPEWIPANFSDNVKRMYDKLYFVAPAGEFNPEGATTLEIYHWLKDIYAGGKMDMDFRDWSRIFVDIFVDE